MRAKIILIDDFASTGLVAAAVAGAVAVAVATIVAAAGLVGALGALGVVGEASEADWRSSSARVVVPGVGRVATATAALVAELGTTASPSGVSHHCVTAVSGGQERCNNDAQPSTADSQPPPLSASK
jgi:hypothetical protein